MKIFNFKEKKLNNKKILIFIGLVLIIAFNFYLYWSEFLVWQDVNDNPFHFALINQAREVWEGIFSGKLNIFYIFDNWNLRWGQGFPLSAFYSHLPQAFLALISFVSGSAFKVFVFVRTLMLIFLPVAFFISGVILGLPLLFDLILAFFITVVFSNGLYGLDASSFLWRSWGISAQLMAVFFLPLSFAFTLRYLDKKKDLGKALLFNFLVAQSHFGIFYLSLFSYPLFSLLKAFKTGFRSWKRELELLIKWGSLTFLSLAYFIIPFFLQGKYRNFSYWDPVWKFNAWGIKQSLVFLLNGDFFDWQRLSLMTIFVLLGFLLGLKAKKLIINFFSFAFLFYFVLFFGRPTFGSLLKFIPGLNEYHLHRIVVFIQFTGLFLAGYFIYFLSFKLFRYFKNTDITKKIIIAGTSFIFLLAGVYVLVKPIYDYAKDNKRMILENQQFYKQDIKDYESLRKKLSSLPSAAVYTGHPGNWGRNFTLGEEPMYMALSTDGFTVMSYMPQTWSPNADTQQFFNDNSLEFYKLYNIAYFVAPSDIKPPEFFKKIFTVGKYNLYQVDAGGWFTLAKSSFSVLSDKRDLVNLVHLWQQSSLFGRDFPVINLSKISGVKRSIDLEMLDLVTYKNLNSLGQSEKTIWQENPFNVNREDVVKAGNINQEVGVQSYKARFSLTADCLDCILVFKQSYNPNWQVKVNGKLVKSFPVFPFFTGVDITSRGDYNVEFVYKPSAVKIFFLIFTVGFFIFLGIFKLKKD